MSPFPNLPGPQDHPQPNTERANPTGGSSHAVPLRPTIASLKSPDPGVTKQLPAAPQPLPTFMTPLPRSSREPHSQGSPLSIPTTWLSHHLLTQTPPPTQMPKVPAYPSPAPDCHPVP